MVLADLLPARSAPPKAPTAHRQLSRQLLIGWIVVAVAVGGFGAWAAFAPLARGSHVFGKVVVDTNRKTVQHLEGGIVSELLVREGQVVKQGQVLLRLDTTQVAANREIALARLIQDRILEARLMAELAGKTDFALPAELTALAADERVRSALRDQRSVQTARRVELQNQVGIQQSRVVQAKEQLRSLEAAQAGNREQYRLISDELRDVRQLFEAGYAAATRVRALEREVARLQSEYSSRIAEIARTRAAITEAEAQIGQLRKTFEREVLMQLGESRARMAELDEQINSANDILARTEIRAPVDGQVVELAVHTVGGVIARGQPILSIVPINDRLIVEGKLKPLDADVVHQGMPAEVRFLSFPRRSTPLLRGKVATLSTDTIQDPDSKTSYYMVRIEIPETEMRRLGDVVVLPGMPAEALIKAGDRTVLDYLISPWLDLFEKSLRED